MLLADEPGRTGALRASVYGYALRSAALDPVVAGGPEASDVALRLGEPRVLTLDVRSSAGHPIERASATFSWHLAGHAVRDYPGPPARRGGGLDWGPRRGEPLWWELPTVPFHVVVKAPDHETAHLGPLDPGELEEAGATLAVTLEAHPRLRGTVTHAGVPVAGASVHLGEDDGRWRPSTTTDEAGRFELAYTSARTATLFAWSRAHGEGELGPLELDPANPPGPLEIAITRAPGAVAGRVVVPPEHDPREVWLTATPGHGYMRVEPDGAFLLPDLPAGPVTVRVLQGYDAGEFEAPISTSGTSRPAGEWFWISHGPGRAPAWLRSPSTYEVAVASGETADLVIDLTAPGGCRLEGRLLIDGAPPPHLPRGRDMYWDLGPRVELVRAGTRRHVAHAELGADGSFVLHANEPGAYELRVDAPTSQESYLSITDTVRLVEGAVRWTHDLPTGALTVLPREQDGGVVAFEGALRWRGPGDLAARTASAVPDPQARNRHYAFVPAGRVELVEGLHSDSAPLLEVEVRAGETTTARAP